MDDEYLEDLAIKSNFHFRQKILVSLFIFSIFLVGCNDSSTKSNNHISTKKNEKYVSEKDFGQEWPLTVPNGYVECKRGYMALFRFRNTTYALNGSARSYAKRYGEYEEIDSIWKDNPEIKGTKMDIGVLINEANKLCNN